MEYSFTQEVTKEDYVSFVNNHMKLSFLKPLNIVLFVVSIGYLTISPFLMPVAERSYTFSFIGLGILALLIAMVMFARKNAEKQYDKSENEFTMTYDVDEEGLVYKLNEGSIEKKWFDFYMALENEKYLYVYVNKNSGMVIVKRAATIEAINFIKTKLKANVKPKKLKLME
jgi:hypothetical protein